jgi:hypothetical protein
MTTVDSFAHRLNRDASIDSICRTCYQTVATADSEAKLIRVEESHSCDQNSEFRRAEVNAQRSTQE